MYNFHSDYIKNKYGNNSRILFTNTYSLLYEIKQKGDIYEGFSMYKEMFDFRNYSPKSNNYDHSDKLVVGKLN